MRRDIEGIGWIAGPLLCGFGLFVLLRLLRDQLGAARTARFVPAKARVRAVHLEARRRISGRAGTSSGADLSLRVRYEYEVGGERHTGTRFAWGRVTRSAYVHAGRLRDAVESGEPIEIWHDPLDPRDAVLVRGYAGTAWRELAWAVASLTLGALLIYCELRST